MSLEPVPLDRPEAEKLTAEIKAWAGTLWVKLKAAHDGQAHKALGYGSWADYVRAEFDMSRSYAYRLISHADAVSELAEAAGLAEVSPIGDTVENQTRHIDVPAVAETIRASVAELPPAATDEDRAEVVRDVIAAAAPAPELPDDADPGPAPVDPSTEAAPGSAPPIPAPAIAKPYDMADLVDKRTLMRAEAGKAVLKQRDLLRLDPVEVALSAAADEWTGYRSLAAEMTRWAAALDQTLSPKLRSVQ